MNHGDHWKPGDRVVEYTNISINMLLQGIAHAIITCDKKVPRFALVHKLMGATLLSGLLARGRVCVFTCLWASTQEYV